MATATISEVVARLPPKQRAEYLRLREARDGGETLREFIARVSPHHPPPRHFAPVIEQLERARLRPGSVNCLISMPPRHGKSTLIQHAIAWWISRRPADTCAYASYSDRQAWSKSRITRDLAALAGVRLRRDTTNLAEWRTPYGGGLLSVGAGSGLTGQGVNGLMVVDDPFKNKVEAESDVVRDRVSEWFDSVVHTRIEGASVFVIHTRWNEDDLIGRLSKDPDFVVINLPAIAEERDPLGRKPGEALWPERFPVDPYLAKRKKRNPYVFDALYQGRPRPRGGKVFGPPHYYDPEKFNPEGCRLVVSADPAAEKKKKSNWSAALAMWVKGYEPDEMVCYIREVYREQVLIPDFVDELISFQGRNGKGPIRVEAVAGFKSVPQMLRKIRPTIELMEVQPIGDKWQRAQPASAAWNDGRILVPYEAPWLGPFLEEVAKFTGVNDKSDDQVDCLSDGFNNAGDLTIFDVL